MLRTEERARVRAEGGPLHPRCVEPYDVIEDGRMVVEVWSNGAISAEAPQGVGIKFDDGSRIGVRLGEDFPFRIVRWAEDDPRAQQ